VAHVLRHRRGRHPPGVWAALLDGWEERIGHALEPVFQ
jgi:hypothetical protein